MTAWCILPLPNHTINQAKKSFLIQEKCLPISIVSVALCCLVFFRHFWSILLIFHHSLAVPVFASGSASSSPWVSCRWALECRRSEAVGTKPTTSLPRRNCAFMRPPSSWKKLLKFLFYHPNSGPYLWVVAFVTPAGSALIVFELEEVIRSWVNLAALLQSLEASLHWTERLKDQPKESG